MQLKKLVAQGEQVMSISQIDEPEPGKSKLGGIPEFRAKLETGRTVRSGLIPPLPPARDVGHAIDIVPGSTPPNESD
jgi:hypothetical protein